MRQICSFNIKNFNEISRTTTTFNLSKMKYKCYVIASIYQRKILVLFGITSFDRIAEMCPIRMICRHQMQSVDHVYADLGRRLIVRIPKKHTLGGWTNFCTKVWDHYSSPKNLLFADCQSHLWNMRRPCQDNFLKTHIVGCKHAFHTLAYMMAEMPWQRKAMWHLNLQMQLSAG